MTDACRRPCPAWFASPQLGIFVHWGIFAIPAWAPRGRAIHELNASEYDRSTALLPYAEWYENAMRIPGSPTAAHHAELYGDRTYQSFRTEFDAAAEAFDAGAWADFFLAAGATYCVFVTKHHDGYCLWPTEVENPYRPGWHTERDFVGELAAAVRARGMKFGLYYSGGLDWTFRPEPIANLGDMFAAVPTGADYRAYANAQVRELIDRYKPSVLWNDIAWPHAEDVPEIFDYYYAAVPDGVTNDRWFAMAPFFESLHDKATRAGFNDMMKARMAAGEQMSAGSDVPGDFRTVEYGMGEIPADRKWESCRGVGLAFGYNTDEWPEDFLTPTQMIDLYTSVTGQGGNLLINIGPRADASIPEEQAAPLRALGQHLSG